MSDKTETPRSDRRAFMKGVAATGAGVAVVAAGGAAAVTELSAEQKPEAAAPAKSQGYRETAHVREYYRLAQF